MARSLLRCLTVLLAVAAAPHARADGGYFSGVKGARAGGRGGAFTARADDVSAVVLNPAGLAGVDGTLLQLGNRFSYNAHEYTRAPTLDWGNPVNGAPPYVEFAAVENDRPWQLLEPFLGVASDLGLPDWGFALTAFGSPGIGRQEFPVDGGQRYMMVSREARILNYTASAAFRYHDVVGVGATLQWIHVPLLRYQLVIDANLFQGQYNPVSSELDMLATTSGSDPFTLNAILGAWYRPVPCWELGVAAQVIPTSIRTEGTLSVEPLNREIVDEVQLTRDGESADDVELSLPLPLTFRAGARYRQLEGGKELFDVELDLTYETWSRVDRFTLDSHGLVATLLAQRVDVDKIEIEKQWQDTFGVHLGGDYALLPSELSVRAGVFFESAVADPSYANVDFVSGRQLGAAAGASWFVGAFELAFSYEYRHEPALAVAEGDARVYQEVPASQCEPPYTDPVACNEQYAGQPAPAVNAGTYRAHSHVLALDALYRF